MKSFLFVSVSVLVFLVVAYFHQIPLISFFAPTAILLVFGPLAVFLLVHVGKNNIGSFFRRIHRNEIKQEDEDIIFGLACIGLIMGFVGTVLSIVSLLYHPGAKGSVASALNLAVGSLLYGLLPPMFMFPFKMNLFRDRQSGLRFYSLAGTCLLILISYVVSKI